MLEWLIVAIKEYLFVKDTLSSTVMGTIRCLFDSLWVQLKKFTASNTPFNSRTYSISTISCWVLKPKKTPLMLHSLFFKTHKKLEGSIGLDEFFLAAMFRLITYNKGDKVFDSKGTLSQRVYITPKICKMELAKQVYWWNQQVILTFHLTLAWWYVEL